MRRCWTAGLNARVIVVAVVFYCVDDYVIVVGVVDVYVVCEYGVLSVCIGGIRVGIAAIGYDLHFESNVSG